MNSEEGTSLAKMAVSVLLVVLVIGAVVTVVYMAYSWFTSGSEKLGDQVNSLDSSAYSQYDDKQCTGTDVLTALKTYRDSDVAILIGNGKGTGNTATSKYADSKDTNAKLKVANYCGLAAGQNNSESGGTTPTTTTPITTVASKDGLWHLGENADGRVDIDPDTGMAKRNTNFSPTQSKDTNNQGFYVSQKANFYSVLVYDDENEVCGIMFLRME